MMKVVAVYPMTEMQKGIAYECALHDSTNAYVSQAVIEIEYPDLAKYRNAWEAVLNKYEIFRTKFVFGHLKDDVQVVMDSANYNWEEQECRIEELHNLADALKTLHVNDLPLIKLNIFKTEDKTFLVWTFHHLLLDGWSMSTTLAKVDDAYQESSSFLEPDYTYSRYIKEVLSRDSANANMFWKGYLEGFSGERFPVITRHRSIAGFDEIHRSLSVSQDSIAQYCKQHKISLAVFFQAAWAIVLKLYTGKNDVLFNVIESGRNSPAAQSTDLIGMTIERHPKRINLEMTQTIGELLEAIKMDDLNLQHQSALSVREEKKILSTEAGKELSNTSFVFENYPSAAKPKSYKISQGSELSTSDMTVSIGVLDHQVHMKLMFSKDMIDNQQGRDILSYLESVVEQLIGLEGEQSVQTVVNAQDLSTIVSSSSPVPFGKTYLDIIKQVSRFTPTKTAIYDGESRISYEQLAANCEMAINGLGGFSIADDQTVGIYMKRSHQSIELMIALQYLRIPYIHLDEKYGQSRIDYIVEDAKVAYIITDDEMASPETFRELNTVHIKELHTQGNGQARVLIAETPEGGCAQIIYTSGSSGQPKGIKVTSDNILSFAAGHQFYAVRKEENFAQASSLAFDASNFEIWLPLFNGASITIVRDPVFDIYRWKQAIDDCQITTAWMTSGLFNTFVDLDFSLLVGLETIFVGGEALSPAHILKAYEQLPQLTLYNGYGPTELTTFTAVYQIPRDIPRNEAVPIGKLLKNAQAQIIGTDGQVRPIGVPGELIVATTRSALGYLNSPEKIEAVFVKKQTSEGVRTFYYTGDTVYFDGELLHYVRRKDNQIKLRGYRIELNEIESVLSQKEGVEQQAVVFNDDAIDAKYIEVFYVGTISDSELKAYLAQQLPSYMVPQKLTQIPRMPLNVNGKVDKAKLKAAALTESISNKEEAVIPNEEFLKNISSFLGLPKIEGTNTLFDYDVDSLKTVRLVHHLNEAYSVKIALKELMMCQNINEMAALYGCCENVIDTKPSALAEMPDRLDPSSMQKSMYYIATEHPDLPIYNIPFMQELSDRTWSSSAIAERFSGILQQNDIFHYYFGLDNEKGVQLWKREALPASFFEVEVENTEQFVHYKNRELNYRFDLKNPEEPLIRLTLLHCKGRTWLLLVIHHIIFDGESMGVLLEQLLSEKAPASGTNQFGEYLQSVPKEVPEESMAFWRTQLTGVERNINFSKPQGFTYDYSGAMQELAIDDGFVGDLNRISKSCQVSKFTVLLTLYSHFLMNHYNQDSVIVGSPVSTRSSEYDQTLGMFLSFVPFVSRKENELSLEAHLISAKSGLYDVLEHSQLSYSDILKAQADPVRSDGLSLIQTVLNYQSGNGDLNELTSISDSHLTAQFPLSLTFYDNENSVMQIEYSTQLFSNSQMKKMMELFMEWGGRVLSDAERKLAEHPLLGVEQVQAIAAGNNPNFKQVNRPMEDYLTPIDFGNSDIALVSNQVSLSYAELLARMENFNRKLREAGAANGDRVVFCGTRSLEQVLVYASCLKYGYVYIPVDQQHPISRLKQIITEAKPQFALFSQLTDTDALGQLKALGAQEFGIASYERRNAATAKNEELAYILYTSGTTGKPKGAKLSRFNLVNFMSSLKEDYGIQRDWNAIYLSSISFDASIFELTANLIQGNAIYIFTDDYADLPVFIDKNDIDFMVITPSLLSAFDFSACRSLKLIVSGGEKFKKNETLSWEVRVLNGYGPTEASVCVSYSTKQSEHNVGMANSNSCVLVTDKDGHIVPDGVEGEIALMGPSVSKSYIDENDNIGRITAAPESLKAYGDILYLTGDLGVFVNHELHYIGRNDQQVKVRGNRIELTEISSVAMKHPGIKEAHTVYEKNAQGKEQLYVYTVLNNKATVDDQQLFTHFKQSLPAYMLPDQIIELGNMPLTVNGKIDEKRLPVPQQQDNRTRQMLGPRNAAEQKILQAWKKVLSLEDISVQDNFFELGGDSIKSIQIVSLLREQHIALANQDVLQLQTIEALAKLHESTEESHQDVSYGKELDTFDLTPIQQWFFDLKLKNIHHWNQSKLFILPPVSQSIVEQTVASLYKQHPMLRAKIIESANTMKVRIQPADSFSADDLLVRFASREEMNKAADSMQQELDIFKGDISKVLYCYHEDQLYVQWIIHHLFVDIHSWSILEHELHRLLRGEEIEVIDHSNKSAVLAKQQLSFDGLAENLTLNHLFAADSREQKASMHKNALQNESHSSGLVSSLLASTILSVISAEMKQGLNVYLETNARFTESLKQFNLNQTVGWMTDFKMVEIPNCASAYQAFALLNRLESKKVAASQPSLYLNLVKLDGKQADYETDANDIPLENMAGMPSTVNIVEFDDEYTITFLNVRFGEQLLGKAVKQFSRIQEKPLVYEYLQSIKQVNHELLTYEEYENISKGTEISAVYPLFPLQEEMIYSGFNSENSYVNHFAWTTMESVEAMKHKFSKLIAKYEALRTKIRRTTGDDFIQIVSKSVESPVYVENLSSNTMTNQLEEINNFIERESSRYSYRTNGTLYAIYLFELENGDTRVVLTFNHILLDGWSVGILMKELWGESVIQQDPGITNKEYSQWLLNKRTQQSDRLLENVDAIEKNLFGQMAAIKNSSDRNQELPSLMSAELSESLKAYCKREKITMANALASVWAYLISKMSGSDRVIFGMVKSGRDCPVQRMDEQVGMFIRTSPVYLTIRDSDSFSSLSHQTEYVNHHNDFANSTLYRRKLNFKPTQELYETIFVVDNYPEPASGTDEKDVKAEEQSNYPLSLSIAFGEDIPYKISYNERFVSTNDAKVISQWIQDLVSVIAVQDGTLEQLPDYSYMLDRNHLQKRPVPVSERAEQKTASFAQEHEAGEFDFKESISHVWSRVLGHTEFDEESDFFEIGGDSLKMSKMIFLLKEDYDYDLDPLAFFDNPTMKVFQKNDNSNEELIVQNAMDQVRIEQAQVTLNDRVLVTGGTGLVGSELIYQLLAKGKTVYCVVRARNDFEAYGRVVDKLKEIKDPSQDLPLNQLIVYCGDLQQENLGLAPEVYQQLATDISEIYNSAGNINFMASLKDSLDVNLLGLNHVMKFAQMGHLKKVNHISTLSVLGHDHYVIEDLELAPISYVKSKVLAEQYLRGYRDKRNGVSIQRLGRIAGNDRNYAVPDNDLFWRLLVSIHQLGCCPQEFLEFETDLTPVNVVVEALLKNADSRNDNHIINYFSESLVTFGRCVELLEEVSGKNIEMVPYEQWMDAAENDQEWNQIKVLIPLFRENVFYEPEENSVVTENSPDKNYQSRITIKNSISDEVIKCFLKNVLSRY